MNLRGVQFNTYHTGTDWKLTLNSKKLPPPEPKEVNISVDGRDGDLDLSEALTGEIKYNNRPASFVFIATEGSYLDREELIREMTREIHGRTCKITIDDDKEHYLRGRCKIVSTTNTNAYATIEVECNCDPYRYALNETVRTFDLTDQTIEILLTNRGRKTVIPEVEIEGNITLAFDEYQISVSSGPYKFPDLVVPTGDKLITLSGSGKITFRYREGVL